MLLARSRDALAPALVLVPDAGGLRADGRQVPRAPLLRGARDPDARGAGCPATCRTTPATRCSSRCGEGFGSRHIFRAHDRAELDFFLGYTQVDSFVQECCRGEEFSIDVFCDLEGRCLNAIPRTMIQSKGGESIKGMTIKDWELIEHARHVAETVGIVGPANVQCFREPDGSLPVTDVNPRFGGGFPLPLAAGSRYPELALALANGERPEPRLGEFRAGVVMTRFFSHLCLTAGDGGSLVSVRGRAPRAGRRRARRGVIRLIAAACGPPGPGGGVRRQRSPTSRRSSAAVHGAGRPARGEAVPAPPKPAEADEGARHGRRRRHAPARPTARAS